MRSVTLGTLGLILAATISAQTTNPAKLRISGIGLDSTFAQVKRALGKPVKEGKATDEQCAGGREKELAYSGAKFHFMDAVDPRKKTFLLVGFEITSSDYTISGIKVGDTEHNVRRRLGTKFTKSPDDETGADQWQYEFTDPNSPGVTNVYISRGKVVKIESAYSVC